MHTNGMITYDAKYLRGEVIGELELFEEGRHEDGREEENDTPEENIGDVGSMRTTGTAHKLPLLFNAVLQRQAEGRAIQSYHMISNKSRFPKIGFMSIYVQTEHKKMLFYSDLQ